MSYMDKMMKQSCDFAKECDRAFKKTHRGQPNFTAFCVHK